MICFKDIFFLNTPTSKVPNSKVIFGKQTLMKFASKQNVWKFNKTTAVKRQTQPKEMQDDWLIFGVA